MLDFEPATSTLARLVGGVRDDQLELPTPCAGTPLGALLDHVDGLAVAFTEAAAKTGGDGAPSADASRLGPDFRPRIGGRLAALADAWKDEDAWQGPTRVAGMEFPGEVAGLIAIDEVIADGWDVAAASGQYGRWPDDLVEAAVQFVAPMAAENPEGIPGMFGPSLAVREGGTPLERLLALTGRDPAWRPPARA